MQQPKRSLLLFLGVAHSLNHSIFLVIPLYLTQIAQDLTTTIETIGFVVAVSGFIYGLGSLLGGPLGGFQPARIQFALGTFRCRRQPDPRQNVLGDRSQPARPGADLGR